jgi:TRAP-type C4-dicarboxylate transport system permease large subunit
LLAGMLLAVPLFVLAANVMNAGTISERILDFCRILVGRLRGGLAQVDILASVIFAGMSGSAIADAAGPGLVTIRQMLKKPEYSPGFAGAVVVASATLGPIIPPSIPMVIYALVSGASVGVLCLGGIYSGAFTPTKAAAVAAAHALVLAGVVFRALAWRSFYGVALQSARSSAVITLVLAGSFMLNYAFTAEGVPQAIGAWVDAMQLGPLAFLLLVNVMFLVLGCLLDVSVLLLVFVPMLLFVTKALTGIPSGAMIKEGWMFIVMLLALLLAMTVFPQIVLWLPQTMGYGAR